MSPPQPPCNADSWQTVSLGCRSWQKCEACAATRSFSAAPTMAPGCFSGILDVPVSGKCPSHLPPYASRWTWQRAKRKVPQPLLAANISRPSRATCLELKLHPRGRSRLCGQLCRLGQRLLPELGASRTLEKGTLLHSSHACTLRSDKAPGSAAVSGAARSGAWICEGALPPRTGVQSQSHASKWHRQRGPCWLGSWPDAPSRRSKSRRPGAIAVSPVHPPELAKPCLFPRSLRKAALEAEDFVQDPMGRDRVLTAASRGRLAASWRLNVTPPLSCTSSAFCFRISSKTEDHRSLGSCFPSKDHT